MNADEAGRSRVTRAEPPSSKGRKGLEFLILKTLRLGGFARALLHEVSWNA
jgi:hypothetical protein